MTPLHFSGLPQDLSVFYDLDRFVRESGIPAIQLSDLKPFAQDPSQEAVTEKISCWSVLERVAGNRNFNDGETEPPCSSALPERTADARMCFEQVQCSPTVWTYGIGLYQWIKAR